MMTAFSLKSRQCYGSCLLATAASPRPSIFWRWRQQQQCNFHPSIWGAVQFSPFWRWRQQQQYSQVEQQSAQTLHYDNRDEKVDDRLGKNPCNFHPSIWGDFFLHYSNPAASSEQQQTWMAERADKLKEEVAKMIASSVTCSLHQRLQLIHVLERLCLDHLFEEEINDALIQIKTNDVSDCDLHTVAMWFYLLRKYGYRVIPDVFLRFKDEEGCFFTNNPMDLLSLYNAAHLRTHGETILDEAILFTRRCLKTTLPSLEGSLAREIKCALEIPLPRRVRIYESKYYISTYEKEATVHESVLQLAKLNSNIMQLHHQKELRIVTSWWKDLEIESRWDKKAAHDLPECMKFALGKILDSYQTIEQELAHEEKYRMPYLKAFVSYLSHLHISSIYH
ncbi:alpha-terpineol synthase, chloroplastic-like isoform X3 [Phragmites australis]|uniref:alpha-terpineol synthase, chloroplastic-like isoform X3 n=1 Tax=Phragmites australis TaxID=29695 RepID=UPI002D77E1FD|nr:alpha-terpineol synthase, chloroplastic-like isoform X3 [Phragmites australis]